MASRRSAASGASHADPTRVAVQANRSEPQRRPPDAAERPTGHRVGPRLCDRDHRPAKRQYRVGRHFHAVKLLLATIHDIEGARAEREERMTLWQSTT